MKINEFELKERIEAYNNKNITILFYNLLKAQIKMDNAKVSYNIKTGFLKISDRIKNNICINIVSVYHIEKNTSSIDLRLDNGINMKIRKN